MGSGKNSQLSHSVSGPVFKYPRFSRIKRTLVSIRIRICIRIHIRIRIGSRICTEVPEIEDARCSKSLAPPPTAQTPGSNWLIFWLETPHGNTFRGTEAIFEFHPGS